MDDIVTVTSSKVRTELGGLVDATHYTGQHTVITKNGKPRVVIVSYEWWTQQQSRADR